MTCTIKRQNRKFIVVFCVNLCFLMLSFWGFLILLFLICFFRHFVTSFSIGYQYVTSNQVLSLQWDISNIDCNKIYAKEDFTLFSSFPDTRLFPQEVFPTSFPRQPPVPFGDGKDEELGCFSNVRGRLKFMHPITKHGKFFLEKNYIRRNIISSLQSSIN